MTHSSVHLVFLALASILMIDRVPPQQVAATASPTGGVATHTLEEIAPSDVFGFATFCGIADAQAAGRTLELYHLIKEPEVRFFLRHAMEKLDQLKGEGGIDDSELAPLRMARAMLDRRVSIAVGGMTLAWERDQPMPIPGMVMAFDMGADHERFLGMARGLLQQIPHKEMVTEEYRGHTMTVVTPPDDVELRAYCVPLGNLYLVGLNEFLVKKCIDGFLGAEDRLVKNEAFQRSRARASKSPLFELYVNTRAIAHRIGGTLPDEWGAAVEALGLADVNGLSMATSIRAGASHDVMAIDAPAPRRGLLGLMPKSGIEKAVERIPSTAMYAAGWKWLPGQTYDLVMAVLNQTLPSRARAEMQRELAQAEQEIGFSIRNDLLGLLGEEVVLYVDVPADAFIPNVVVSIEMTDVAKAKVVLGQIMQRGGVSVRDVQWHDHVLQVVRIPGGDVPLSPAWTFHSGRLIFSPTVAGVRAALKNFEQDGNGLAGADAFAGAMKSAGLTLKGALTLEYMDTPRVVRWAYQAMEHLMPGAPLGEDAPVDLAEIPGTETVVKHVRPYVGVSHQDDNGLFAESHGSGFADMIGLLALSMGDLEMRDAPLLFGFLASQVVMQELGAESAPKIWEAEAEPEGSHEPETRSQDVAPTQIINSVKPGDPREKELQEELAGLNEALADEPSNAGVLFERALVQGQLRNYAESIADYHRARAAGMQTATVSYNLACMYSLTGDTKEGLAWLDKALQDGFVSWKHIDQDSDLDNLRKLPNFNALIRRHRTGR